MDLKEIKWEGIDWINLVQDRDEWWALVNMMWNLRFQGILLSDKLFRFSNSSPWS